jgi:hypothetical protein
MLKPQRPCTRARPLREDGERYAQLSLVFADRDAAGAWPISGPPSITLSGRGAYLIGPAELSLLPEGMDVQVIILDGDRFAGEEAPF